MELEEIKRTLDSASGKALKTYLLAKLSELRDIENLQEFSTTAAQTLEVKAQRRAYLKLKDILGKLLTFEEERRPKNPADSYSVQ